jgi:hypothetical protein
MILRGTGSRAYYKSRLPPTLHVSLFRQETNGGEGALQLQSKEAGSTATHLRWSNAIGAPKRVGDCVHHRRRRPDRPGLRRRGRGDVAGLEIERGQVVGAREAIVEEARGQQLAVAVKRRLAELATAHSRYFDLARETDEIVVTPKGSNAVAFAAEFAVARLLQPIGGLPPRRQGDLVGVIVDQPT